MALKIGFSPAALKDYTYIYIQKDIYIYKNGKWFTKPPKTSTVHEK